MTPPTLCGAEGIVRHVLTKTQPVLSIALCAIRTRSHWILSDHSVIKDKTINNIQK